MNDQLERIGYYLPVHGKDSGTTSDSTPPEPGNAGESRALDRIAARAAAERTSTEEVGHSAEFLRLDFSVAVSARYHAKRRGWFDALARWPSVAGIVAGSAAFAAIVGGMPTAAALASLVIAAFSGLNVAFGFGERSRKHDELFRRFNALAVEIAEAEAPTGAQIRKWKGAKLRIEAEEPTVKDVLNVICHNEEAEARGYQDDHVHVVRWWQRLFAQVVSLPPSSFQPKTR